MKVFPMQSHKLIYEIVIEYLEKTMPPHRLRCILKIRNHHLSVQGINVSLNIYKSERQMAVHSFL